MNSAEFKILAQAMKAAYSARNFMVDEQSVKLWYKMLKDLDYELCSAAVMKHISLSEFPPTIAGIRQACVSVAAVDEMDWLEGWNLIQRVRCRYGYNRPEDALATLRKIDETTAEVAGMLGWVNLCMSENPTADRANFRQCYETKKRREMEHAKLPPALRQTIEGIADRLKLGTERSLEKNGKTVCIANSDLPLLQVSGREPDLLRGRVRGERDTHGFCKPAGAGNVSGQSL